MRKTQLLGLTFCLATSPFAVMAEDFDGSKPLLCASTSVIECDPLAGCMQVMPESIGAPQFLRVDAKAKEVKTMRATGDKRSTTIERMEQVDDKLIMQGAEDGVEGVRDGLGWTLAISADSGKMVLTASGDQVGFVIFGACTPL